MTTDNAIAALKQYLETEIGATSPLTGIEILLTGDDGTLDPPFISIIETGSEEHETLLGVLKVSIHVTLATVPGETSAAATPDTTHRTMTAALKEILADYDAAKASCDTWPYFSCFDVRGLAMMQVPDDGRRTTRFALVMTCE